MGFDATGRYVLTVSHSGRGVFDTRTWERVSRDTELAYPCDGYALGIGPLSNQRIEVQEINYETGKLEVESPDRSFVIEYEDGVATVNAKN